LDAAAQRHRIGAGDDVLQPLAIDRLGQDRRGRRAVPGVVIRLAGGLLHQLGAHVLEVVGQLDFVSHRGAVFRHLGAAPSLVQHCRTAPGAEGDLYRSGELLHPGAKRLAGRLVK